MLTTHACNYLDVADLLPAQRHTDTGWPTGRQLPTSPAMEDSCAETWRLPDALNADRRVRFTGWAIVKTFKQLAASLGCSDGRDPSVAVLRILLHVLAPMPRDLWTLSGYLRRAGQFSTLQRGALRPTSEPPLTR